MLKESQSEVARLRQQLEVLPGASELAEIQDVRVCARARAFMCVHTCGRTCVYVHEGVCARHVYTYACGCVWVCVRLRVHAAWMCVCACMRMCFRAHLCTHE